MTDANELRAALVHYTGSEELYRHALVKSFTYTEGVRHFFQNAGGGAYWLSDILATEPAIARAVRDAGMHLAVLDVKDGHAKLTVARDAESLYYEGVGGRRDLMGYSFQGVVLERQIDMTDCPAGLWKFYLIENVIGDSKGGQRAVITCLLPSEY